MEHDVAGTRTHVRRQEGDVKVDKREVEAAVLALLWAIGEDPMREGLADTPARVARWWAEFVDYDPGKLDATFDVVRADQMVAVSGVRVWSLCEHHLLPFYADLTIGYIANDRIVGLSKMARMAHGAAHGLQLQEKLVADVANQLADVLGHTDVAVLATGEHLCMTMRGIKTPGLMHTSVLRGAFRQPEVRAEFQRHVGRPS